MTDDLVARLRELAGDEDGHRTAAYHTVDEAANRIEALMAVIASMKPEVNLLNCLRRAGVDNWDWYESALELMEEEDDQ